MVKIAAPGKPVEERGEALAHGRDRELSERAASPGGIEVEVPGGVAEIEIVAAVEAICEAVAQGMRAEDGREVHRSFVNVGGDVVARATPPRLE